MRAAEIVCRRAFPENRNRSCLRRRPARSHSLRSEPIRSARRTRNEPLSSRVGRDDRAGRCRGSRFNRVRRADRFRRQTRLCSEVARLVQLLSRAARRRVHRAASGERTAAAHRSVGRVVVSESDSDSDSNANGSRVMRRRSREPPASGARKSSEKAPRSAQPPQRSVIFGATLELVVVVVVVVVNVDYGRTE